jgi:hypothetical protein
MGYAELIAKIRTLPEDKQTEVFDFVEFLASRFSIASAGEANEQAEWSEEGFASFSLSHALRDMDDDPVSYGRDDLREVWR